MATQFPESSESPWINPFDGSVWAFEEDRWVLAQGKRTASTVFDWIEQHEALPIHAEGLVAPLQDLP